jgi:hypothetical protein
MAAFNVFKNMDTNDEDDEDSDSNSQSPNANPKDIPASLPDVTNPVDATPQLDSEQQDKQNIIDAKQKMRTGKAPMGNPGQEPELEKPWYSPDSLAAGAAAGPIEGALSGGSLNNLLSGESSSVANAISPEVKAASIQAKNKLMASLGKGAANLAEELTPYDQWAINAASGLKKKVMGNNQ